MNMEERHKLRDKLRAEINDFQNLVDDFLKNPSEQKKEEIKNKNKILAEHNQEFWKEYLG